MFLNRIKLDIMKYYRDIITENKQDFCSEIGLNKKQSKNRCIVKTRT